MLFIHSSKSLNKVGYALFFWWPELLHHFSIVIVNQVIYLVGKLWEYEGVRKFDLQGQSLQCIDS